MCVILCVRWLAVPSVYTLSFINRQILAYMYVNADVTCEVNGSSMLPSVNIL